MDLMARLSSDLQVLSPDRADRGDCQSGKHAWRNFVRQKAVAQWRERTNEFLQRKRKAQEGRKRAFVPYLRFITIHSAPPPKAVGRVIYTYDPTLELKHNDSSVNVIAAGQSLRKN